MHIVSVIIVMKIFRNISSSSISVTIIVIIIINIFFFVIFIDLAAVSCLVAAAALPVIFISLIFSVSLCFVWMFVN